MTESELAEEAQQQQLASIGAIESGAIRLIKKR
jgi:hypothetical protein